MAAKKRRYACENKLCPNEWTEFVEDECHKLVPSPDYPFPRPEPKTYRLCASCATWKRERLTCPFHGDV